MNTISRLYLLKYYLPYLLKIQLLHTCEECTGVYKAWKIAHTLHGMLSILFLFL